VGVNGHTTRCTSHVSIRGLAALADVQLRATEMQISAAQWALEAREGLYFALLITPDNGKLF